MLVSNAPASQLEWELRHCAVQEAASKLAQEEPQFSALTVISNGQRRFFLALLIAMAAMLLCIPRLFGLLATVFIALGYLSNAVFRAWLFWVGAEQADAEDKSPKSARPLPLYTVLIPLYREANMLPQLGAALRSLNYPRRLLDVKLVVEEDDDETIVAANKAAADGLFEVIEVPPGEPRTKPRACNYALQFARGEFLVIFDAEDQPEPDQLLKAVTAFRRLPEEVACLQARLNFFNARECWITRMFALDYALWFDFLLPGLDKLGIPMPLGGTSNHFRVEALRAINAWDPFNVTEDADLGIRLSRLGMRVKTLDSTTYEEATNGVGNWLRQRTRWLKGYMQTSTAFSVPITSMT
ncbi:MAG: glycosyltransferase [Rhizomicrobium sp.]